jgi:hypothetical protein
LVSTVCGFVREIVTDGMEKAVAHLVK